MKRVLALLAAMTVSAPAIAQIDPAVLDAEIAAVVDATESGSIVLDSDQLNRPTCEIERSTGDALIDNRLCRFAVDCIGANPDSFDAADACMTERTNKIIEKLARRNISMRERNATY